MFEPCVHEELDFCSMIRFLWLALLWQLLQFSLIKVCVCVCVLGVCDKMCGGEGSLSVASATRAAVQEAVFSCCLAPLNFNQQRIINTTRS